MNKFDFCEELKTKMDVNEIDNDALYYQINMFQNACGFDIKKGGYGNIVSIDNTNIKFCNKKYQSDKLNYYFEIMKGKVGKKDSFTIKGSYNDLLFAFHNFYKKDKNEDISQITFSFFLEKDFEDARYTVDVETINEFKTKFNFNRKPKNDDELTDYFTFYSKRSDFENVFGVIKSFIDNPKNVYFMYKRIMDFKEVYYNNNEIDLVKQNNELKVTKQGKLLKKVINTEK